MKRSSSQASDSDLRYQLFELFMTVGPAFGKWTTTRMRDIGTNFPRTRLLNLLYAQQPLRMGDLAEGLEVTPRNVTRLVDSLEEAGHVRRTIDRQDRRITWVALTPAGKERAEMGIRGFEKFADELFGEFSEREQRDFVRILKRFHMVLAARGAFGRSVPKLRRTESAF